LARELQAELLLELQLWPVQLALAHWAVGSHHVARTAAASAPARTGVVVMVVRLTFGFGQLCHTRQQHCRQDRCTNQGLHESTHLLFLRILTCRLPWGSIGMKREKVLRFFYIGSMTLKQLLHRPPDKEVISR
jgi:hypothetical protein